MGVRRNAPDGSLGDIHEQVVGAARGRFAFLEQRPGCRVEVENASLQTTIAYVLEDLTFEVHLDWRHMNAILMLGRTMGGQRPPGYLVNFGVRVRYHPRDLLPVTAQASSPDALPAYRRPRTRSAKATAGTVDRVALANRMVDQITAMAAALAESHDDVCANARLGFRASDKQAALNPPPCRRTPAPDSWQC